MSSRWFYTANQRPAYYQDGDIYSKDGVCEFSVSDGWWYPIKGGTGAYYVSDKWVYSADGKASFYFS